MQNISQTLQILLARFGGQVLIPFTDASESVGILRQTARNRLSNGTFPMPTCTSGGRRFIHIKDLANFVDSLQDKPAKTKRGRPTKASKFQSQAGGVQ